MARKSKISDKVKEIIKTSQKEANNSTYCIKCKSGYINPETLTGFCKRHALFIFPKPIDAFDSCKDWEDK